MRLLIAMTLAMGFTGCATLQPVPLTVPESHIVENKALPIDPRDVETGAIGPEWTTPMDEEECISPKGDMVSNTWPCPGKGGILYSEAKSARMGAYVLSYKQLRSNYEQDRLVWASQRALYEGRLSDAGTALQLARPGWFKEHAFELGILAGFLVGAGASVAIVYGVVPAFQPSSP